MDIQDRIVAALNQIEGTQKELGNAIEVSLSTLNSWLKQKRDIPSQYIVPICEFLGISVWYLLTGEENPTLYAFNGEKLRSYRILNGMSQTSLADISGVSEGSIRKYEAGTRNPKKEQIKKLSDALKIADSALLKDNGDGNYMQVRTPQKDMTIIQRIYDLLHRTGKKNAHLAEHLGVSSGQISNWKSRDSDPPAKHFIPMAEFLGVSVKYLLTGEETPNVKGSTDWNDFSEKKLTTTTDKDYRADNEQMQFYAAADPLMAYLRENWPHAKVIVNQSIAELLSGHMTAHVDYGSGSEED